MTPIGRRGKAQAAVAAVILGLALSAGGDGGLAGQVAAGQGDVQAQGAPAPVSTPIPIKLVYAQPSAAFTPLFVAREQSLFAKEGLEVSVAQVTGSAAVATLLSGESQVISTGATEVASVDVAGGDLVMLAAGSNLPVFSLYVNPSVHSVNDLIGKKIAVTTFGTSTDTTARIFLERYGLTGKVEILGTGGTMAGIVAAMTSGIAAGGILSPPTTAKAEGAGFTELINGVRLRIPMTQTAIAVRKSYLVSNRGIVLRFMRAYLAAWAFVRNPANEAATESAIARYTRATPEEAAVAYKAFYPVWQQTKIPRVDLAGVRNVLRFSTNAGVRGIRPASLIDESVLDELIRSGYVNSLE